MTTAVPLLISIEGNIGIGKSTLMSELKARLAHDASVVFVDEPVSLWEDYGLLAAMYSGEISRTAFQLMVLNTRCAWLTKALAVPGVRVVICERSIWSDKAVFADVNITGEAERAAYECTFEALCATLPEVTHATVLLDAPLDVILARVQKRARAAEQPTETEAAEEPKGGIDWAYLREQQAHYSYLERCSGPARTVDATAAPAQVAHDVFSAISDFVRGRSDGSPIGRPHVVSERAQVECAGMMDVTA